MKVIMVGGGTGGHIYPAIAVAQAVQEEILDSKILFVGSEEGLEVKIVPKERFSLVTIKSRGLLRKISYKAISAPFLAVAGFFQSIDIIRSFMPDVIVATGGFVSLPVVIAGFFLRVPVVLHESNVIPGLATRICKWFASRIIISFEDSRRYFKWRKVYCVGVPVRKEIIKSVKGIAIQNMGLRQDQKIVLVIGGSQGARSINKVIVDSISEIAGLGVQLIHVCGERDYKWVHDITENKYAYYRLIPYMYNIWDGLAAADLIISRAGATAVSEILARGTPSILIPFPYSAEGHQDRNAEVLRKAGAATVIMDKDLNKGTLVREMQKILNDKQLYMNMQNESRNLAAPNAAGDIAGIISNMFAVKKRSSAAGPKKYARKRKKKQ